MTSRLDIHPSHAWILGRLPEDDPVLVTKPAAESEVASVATAPASLPPPPGGRVSPQRGRSAHSSRDRR